MAITTTYNSDCGVIIRLHPNHFGISEIRTLKIKYKDDPDTSLYEYTSDCSDLLTGLTIIKISNEDAFNIVGQEFLLDINDYPNSTDLVIDYNLGEILPDTPFGYKYITLI